jgi:hypothetical protein
VVPGDSFLQPATRLRREQSLSSRTELFVKIKQTLRNHPDWTDEQLTLMLGIKEPEQGLIPEARRDLEAG